MNNKLHYPVLSLNKNWLVIGDDKTVKDAITAMTGGTNGNPPAFGLDQTFEINPDGTVNWSNMISVQPVSWAEWIKLPIRFYDRVISSSTMTMRAPTVIIQSNYGKVPRVKQRPTKDAIRRRDGGTCQYTGVKLTWANSNIDHVIPVSRGGKNTFENMVLCEKGLNSLKADKTPEEAGIRLIRKPSAPPELLISNTITVAKHPSWVPFLTRVTETRYE